MEKKAYRFRNLRKLKDFNKKQAITIGVVIARK